MSGSMIPGRNNYLMSRTLRHYLLAAVMTLLSQQLVCITDAVVLGNFVSSEAMSSINVLNPLLSLIATFYICIGGGASIRFSRMIGRRDYMGAKSVFSVAVLTLGLGGLLMAVPLMLLGGGITKLLCSDGTISALSNEYLFIYALGLPFLFVNFIMASSISAEGKPKAVSKVTLLANLLNAALDILFVCILDWGIQGAALATTLCNFFMVLMYWRIIRRFENSYSLLDGKGRYKEHLVESAREGMPGFTNNIIGSFVFYLLNTVILTALGTEGINIWSVCMQVYIIVLLVVSGMNSASITIGGLLYGENDMKGLSMLHTLVFKLWLVPLAVLVFLTLLWPGAFLAMFGASPQMYEAGAERALRIFALSFVPLSFVMLQIPFLQILKHYSLAVYASSTPFILGLAGAYVCSLISPEALWWGFPLAFALLCSSLWISMFLIHLKKPGVSALTLIPKQDERKILDMSVPYDMDGLSGILDAITEFLKDNGVEGAKANTSILITEELVVNIIRFASKNRENQRFDLRMSVTSDSDGQRTVITSIHDDGKAFDPTLNLEEEERKPVLDRKLGLRIINKMGSEIIYKYMYGQNTVIVKVK
ncbi:MAG: polysaccharide biosynthesis C-terminal domain-containing protein [Bacteroidales bacterium]|nr:polysaccharide biosynthesis C-terminal domain-containing protein [Bacteroidales bacterium]